jgi:hypothetical protein
MNRRAQFIIRPESTPEILIIEDIGPHDRYLTITNDVKNVVAALAYANQLPDGRRLLYYDSEGNLDEIVVDGGRFVGFRPARRAS